MNIFVTGASGFIGSVLVGRLLAAGHSVTAFSRNAPRIKPAGVRIETGDITSLGDAQRLLAGHQVVIHLAARAHVLKESAGDPLQAFRQINRDATLALAAAASAAGVERFVFLSSIGVNGAVSGQGIFVEDSPTNPQKPYAISKLEAEQGLWQLAGSSPMSITIVRPPLVYGAGAPGNIRRLLGLVNRSLPLPFANADAPKSFVGVENLADFLVLAMVSQAAVNRLFLVADNEKISTALLIGGLATGLDKQARLFPIPGGLVELGKHMPVVGGMVSQLFTPLAVDNSAARLAVGWQPKPTLDGIVEMARQYAASPW